MTHPHNSPGMVFFLAQNPETKLWHWCIWLATRSRNERVWTSENGHISPESARETALSYGHTEQEMPK